MANEVLVESIETEDADLVLVAYGLTSRIAHKAVELARNDGLKVGLLRPKTLFPFPSQHLSDLAQQATAMMVIEMSAGQMVEDVRLAVNGKVPVYFQGRMGGVIPQPDELLKRIHQIYSSSTTQVDS